MRDALEDIFSSPDQLAQTPQNNKTSAPNQSARIAPPQKLLANQAVSTNNQVAGTTTPTAHTTGTEVPDTGKSVSASTIIEDTSMQDTPIVPTTATAAATIVTAATAPTPIAPTLTVPTAPLGLIRLAPPPFETPTRDPVARRLNFSTARKRRREASPQTPATPIKTPAVTDLLKQALQLVEKAQKVAPGYSNIATALRRAIAGQVYTTVEQKVDTVGQKLDTIVQLLQQPAQPAQLIHPTHVTRPEQAPHTRSYAAVAATPKTPAPPACPAPITHPASPTRPVSILLTAPAPPAGSGPTNPSKKPRRTRGRSRARAAETPANNQVIVITEKGTKQPTLEPVKIRDHINLALQASPPIVARVAESAKGNIVITTTPYASNQILLESIDLWKDALANFHIRAIQAPENWIKLIAHKVPVSVFQQADSFDSQLFKLETETYNQLKLIGNAGWLAKSVDGKRASSVVFAVATEEEKWTCLTGGLTVAGVTCKVEILKPFTPKTQCFRCQAYGHDPTKCRRKPACRICGETHFTKDHACDSCQTASNSCSHKPPYCANCSGAHTADSSECEVRRALIL